jgi:hypothetical protein
MWKKLLLILLPFVLIEVVLLFYAGIAYFLLFFLLFHLMITSARLFPKLAKIILGEENYNKSHKHWEQGNARRYKMYWLISNILWLALVMASFFNNFRLLEIIIR